ncbi:MAG: HPr family phosphocarrier protein [Hyphomicrobiales bacterium]|nr:HPr family phosphocarrier protein [Hyphomicrobiales bacterium]
MTGAGQSPGETLSRELLITNKRGLHARAARKFVQCVETFDADVSVTKDSLTVGGNSIMGLLMLAAMCGCSIEVSASGPQAAAALDKLDELVSGRFGEE